MQYEVPVNVPAAQPRQKRTEKPIVLFALSAGAAIVVLVAAVITALLLMGSRYAQALASLEKADYAGAQQRLSGVAPFYKDAKSLADYARAGRVLQEGKYDEAKALFGALDGFRDSGAMAREADYRAAKAQLDNGALEAAGKAFEALGLLGYKDSAALKSEADYRLACNALTGKDFKTAQQSFAALGEYKDSPDKLTEADEGVYGNAVADYKKASYASASEGFALTAGYKDTDKYLRLIEAHQLTLDESRGDYAKTKRIFDRLMEAGAFEDANALKLSDAFIPYFLEGDWMNRAGGIFFVVYYDSAEKVWVVDDDELDEYDKFEKGTYYYMNKSNAWVAFFTVTYVSDDSCKLYFPSEAETVTVTRGK